MSERNKKKRRKISISRKLLSFMLSAVLAQGILFLSVLYFNGGLSYLRENAVNSFANMTNSRKNTLENLMVNSWSNLGRYQDGILHTIEKYMEESQQTTDALLHDRALNNQILGEVAPDIIKMLRDSGATEGYIMLGGYGDRDETTQHCGLLIRDLDLAINSGNDDLLMEVGAASIAQEMGIAMDSYWTSTFDLEDGDGGGVYYRKPVEAAENNPDIDRRYLGYWSGFYRWKENDMRVLSYSVPLKVNDVVCGVLGITVSEEHLSSLLPYKELDDESRGAYVLATTDKQQQIFQPVFGNGMLPGDLIDGDKEIIFDRAPRYGELYSDEQLGKGGTANYLNLYSRQSPFYSTKWALVALESEEVLFEDADKLQIAILAAFTLSILLGIAAAIVGSYNFTKPIMRMGNILRSRDYRETLNFPPSDVIEIDALSNAITTLNKSVRENASKLSQIIELMDLPIGAIEYLENSDKVFCTDKVRYMIPAELRYDYEGYIEKESFEEFLQDCGLGDLLMFDDDSVYQTENKNTDQWLSFKSKNEEGRTLIIVRDITEDMQEKKKLEYERDYDILTKLLNRRAFKRKLLNMLSDPKKYKLVNGAMIMWDLDNLKYVNDTYGHDCGDQYIQQAAEVFGALEKDGAIVGRISGDEFLAFIPNWETKNSLIQEIHHIKERLNQTKLKLGDGEQISLRASGGIAWYPDDGRTYDELVKYADFAMYDTKNSFKGAFKEFDMKNYERDYLLLQGKEEFNRLIDEEAIKYVFQPIISAVDGNTLGYEALMRPTIGSMMAPADVMRLAKAQSRLQDIEILTFTKALQYCSWQEKALGDRKIFINSIPDQMLPQEIFRKLLNEYGKYYKQLVVEIIESEQANTNIMKEKRELLHGMGVQLAVDDFGAGYSTESSLLYVHPDYVKIDMDITRGIHNDSDRQTLVANLVHYTKPRGIYTIAEGVEYREEMAALIRLGVDFLQGYYIGMPEEEMRDVSPKVKQEILTLQKRQTPTNSFTRI